MIRHQAERMNAVAVTLRVVAEDVLPYVTSQDYVVHRGADTGTALGALVAAKAKRPVAQATGRLISTITQTRG
ncbi:protein of unknown function [Trichlorobacter ammonificans]|uniref:Uncharacterized protein n=1 Tax=Trichlorobacter ammonificans TaxID=2916410 RepID=A0ABM9D9W1_9BACT|nr:protein of unknown function [Trichlorobacter ammonificans]